MKYLLGDGCAKVIGLLGEALIMDIMVDVVTAVMRSANLFICLRTKVKL